VCPKPADFGERTCGRRRFAEGVAPGAFDNPADLDAADVRRAGASCKLKFPTTFSVAGYRCYSAGESWCRTRSRSRSIRGADVSEFPAIGGWLGPLSLATGASVDSEKAGSVSAPLT